jgi:peptide chain release factor subunit 1
MSLNLTRSCILSFATCTHRCGAQDKETGGELEVQEKQPLLEWLANNYKKFGCALEFVTNKSQEGSQFCRGFGGIGGILRYQVRLKIVIFGLVNTCHVHTH